MKPVGIVALGLTLFGSVLAFQRGRGYNYEAPAVTPADAAESTEYQFARLAYRSGYDGWRGGGSWATDAPKAERQFVQGVRRLTRIHTRSLEQNIDIDSDEIYDYPWIYAVEVGYWQISDSQAKRLRDYLDRGGFLMADDFHGTREWDAFMEGLRRIFPDRPVVELEDSSRIFHVLYDLPDRIQIPGVFYIRRGVTYERDGIEPRWRAVFDDKGRIQVAICHNMDLGDAWEWADLPEYPEKFTSMAYRIGINYILYSMTH